MHMLFLVYLYTTLKPFLKTSGSVIRPFLDSIQIE